KRRSPSLGRHVRLRVALAEEHFAGSERAETDDRRELLPAPLHEAERHAVPRPDDHHAIRVLGGDHVIAVVRIAIESALALAFGGHEHDRVAAALEEGLVRRVVREAAVAVLLAADLRRM